MFRKESAARRPNMFKNMFKVSAGGTFRSVFASTISWSLIGLMLVETSVAQNPPLDGVTLYRALFFAQGPLADKIPTVVKVRPFLPPDYLSLQDRIIDRIQAKDPNFFKTFATEIQSGDHLRVAAALLNANKIQREALMEVAKTVDTPFARNVRQVKPQDFERPVGRPEVETIVDVFVNAIVFVVLPLPPFIGAVRKPEELKGLSFEHYVSEIIKAVPAAPTVLPQPNKPD
jgi:SdpC family antimicrobial peptide